MSCFVVSNKTLDGVVQAMRDISPDTIEGREDAIGKMLMNYNIQAFNHCYNNTGGYVDSYYYIERVLTNDEKLTALRCFLYQILDHEQGEEHEIYIILNEVKSIFKVRTWATYDRTMDDHMHMWG